MLEFCFGTRLIIIIIICSELKGVVMSVIFSKVIVGNIFVQIFLTLECFKAKVRS